MVILNRCLPVAHFHEYPRLTPGYEGKVGVGIGVFKVISFRWEPGGNVSRGPEEYQTGPYTCP